MTWMSTRPCKNRLWLGLDYDYGPETNRPATKKRRKSIARNSPAYKLKIWLESEFEIDNLR